MPAAAIKGIILSISIITALGIAVLENPQIQVWLEQQRQKILELLRNLNEELDPQSRRTAEAFAFRGRTPANDGGLRREMSGSLEAVAVATGRSLENDSQSKIRRIPVRGPTDPDEAEERRRKGREYLASRNQQMYELKQRKNTKVEVQDAEEPPSPTSFEDLVDQNGKLKQIEPGDVKDKGKGKTVLAGQALPAVPNSVLSEMHQSNANWKLPLLAEGTSSSANGWQIGSQLANPFGDEYAMDRSETPKPPVPPKVAIEVEDVSKTPAMPGSFTPPSVGLDAEPMTLDGEELSYDEQLAIALSLSEAEAAKAAAVKVAEQHSESEEQDHDLRAAIEASLKDMNRQGFAKSLHKTLSEAAQPFVEAIQPLIDVSLPTPSSSIRQPAPRGHWENVFNQDYSPSHEPLSMMVLIPVTDEDDELYRVTPQLTSARLATLESQHSQAMSPSSASSRPYDPVREAANAAELQQLATAMEASFYSAASSAPSPAETTSHTMNHEQTPQLIDDSEDVASPEVATTPVLRPTTGGFRTDSDSDSDTFASLSAAASHSQSRPRSEMSNVEVIDLLEDSDVDMLSEEGDGIVTPDSWTEVGSRDGESELEDEHEAEARSRWRQVGSL